jgi:hypothetical protein
MWDHIAGIAFAPALWLHNPDELPDGMTWETYEQGLDRHRASLSRTKAGPEPPDPCNKQQFQMRFA